MSQGKWFFFRTFGLVVFCFIVGFFLLALIGLFWGSSENARFKYNKDPVVVFEIEGPLFESLPLLRDLEDIRQNSHIKAVVLRINSPGGAVAPSQEIFAQVLKIKEKSKKVIVSMGTVAASGAYYVASAADKIVASPGTVTGSIGVILQSFGVQKLVEKLLIEPRAVTSGKYKNVGSVFEELTEAQKEYFQDLTDNIYQQFLKDVSEQRKIPFEKMKTLAEGRIYTGYQARENGLVDELGNLYDAIALAKREAQLKDDVSVNWPEPPSFFEKIFHGAETSSSDLVRNLLGKLNIQGLPLWIFSDTDFLTL